MTITLGFDTATRATAVALRHADGTITEARDDPAAGQHPGHATRLLALADDLLRQSDVGWESLTLIATGVGPGTFTGLRIGLATARGLAQSLGIQARGVSSLAALARPALSGPHAAERVLAVLDARRGEVFAAAYDHRRGTLSPPQALNPERLGHILTETRSALAVGDGALRYAEQLRGGGAEIPPAESPLHLLTAAAICQLAEHTPASERDQLLPDYCRRADAEIALESASR